VRTAATRLAPTSPTDPLGRALHLRHFAIADRIGGGPRGSVYAAVDPDGQDLAIKVARCPEDRLEATVERLRDLRRIVHVNVVRVFDAGGLCLEGESYAWVAMSRLEGGDLSTQWTADSPITVHRAVAIFAGVAIGLAAAHAAGEVHGDIKPTNIVLDADGRGVLVDLGLAEGPTDTLAYAAPECLAGRRPSRRSDVFSLCVALHEVLAGRRPFEGDDRETLIESMERGPLPLPESVPARLRGALIRGLRPDRADRFENAAMLGDTLVEALDEPAWGRWRQSSA